MIKLFQNSFQLNLRETIRLIMTLIFSCTLLFLIPSKQAQYALTRFIINMEFFNLYALSFGDD